MKFVPHSTGFQLLLNRIEKTFRRLYHKLCTDFANFHGIPLEFQSELKKVVLFFSCSFQPVAGLHLSDSLGESAMTEETATLLFDVDKVLPLGCDSPKNGEFNSTLTSQ